MPLIRTAINLRAATVFALVLTGAATADAQRPAARPAWSDSTPARIMGLANKAFPSDVALEVLRQRHQAYSLQKRQELADSIVGLAIRVPGAADAAVGAVAASGYADNSLGGTADQDALGRLIQIHREAKDDGTRRGAIGEMPLQINPYRALPYLQSVTVSATDRTALTAVSEIQRLTFDVRLGTVADRRAAESVLRQMLDQRLVKQASVASYLCEIALRHKWPTNGQCRGIS
jgi:hypothetical protein